MLDAEIVGRVIPKFREERKPTLETFYIIGEALGVRPSVLLAAIVQEMEKT